MSCSNEDVYMNAIEYIRNTTIHINNSHSQHTSNDLMLDEMDDILESLLSGHHQSPKYAVAHRFLHKYK